MLCLISAMHVGRIYTLLLSFTLSSAPKDRACPQIMETSDCAMFFSFNLSLIIINSIRERKRERERKEKRFLWFSFSKHYR